MAEVIRGRCNCGAVAFEIDAPLPPPTACHCSQCRKQSGHVWVSAHLSRAAFRLLTGETLTWYRASPRAERGFCATCGAFLFWRSDAEPLDISVAMGALEAPTGVRLARHIFTADKGDYYDIADGLPQRPQGQEDS